MSRRLRSLRPLWLALLFAVLALHAPAESLVLSNAVIHPVSGPDIPNGCVWLKDGKIAAVGAQVAAPGATVIDLAGQHVYPGIILPDSSLGLAEISAIRATIDTDEVGKFTPDVQSWIAVNPDSELLPVARAGGITHFEVAPGGNVLAGQSALLQMTGWTWEQMAVKKPAALHLFWPVMTLDFTPKESADDPKKWKSPEDQAKERDRKLREIDDFFADARAYATARDKNPSGTPLNPTWEAMLPLVRGEIPLMIHADEDRQIRAAVAWATSRQLRVILAGARDAWRMPALIAEHKIPVIYEATFSQPSRDTEPYDVHFRTPGQLHAAGVTVLFSEGLGSWGAAKARNVAHEAAQAAAFGLPVDEALKGLTLYPAQVLGMADRLGSLEPGKDATIIVNNGPLLDIRTRVTRMWIAGTEVSLESRHTRLYDKYRQRPAPAK